METSDLMLKVCPPTVILSILYANAIRTADDIVGFLFYALLISVIGYMAWSFFTGGTTRNQNARTPRNGGGGPGGGPGGFGPGGGGNYGPPPPYSKDDNESSTSTSDQSWRPGFFSGAATGAAATSAAAYAYNNFANRREERRESSPPVRDRWSNDRGEGSSSMGSTRRATGLGGSNVR